MELPTETSAQSWHSQIMERQLHYKLYVITNKSPEKEADIPAQSRQPREGEITGWDMDSLGHSLSVHVEILCVVLTVLGSGHVAM